MSVVLDVEEIGPCRKQLKIEIPAPAVEAETARVRGEFGRKASLPGFRKGKVPQSLVQRHFAGKFTVNRGAPGAALFRQAAAEGSIRCWRRKSRWPRWRPALATFLARVEVRRIRAAQLRFQPARPPVVATAEELQTAISTCACGCR
jgi:hypothetical protein